jgi:hypothetical protein
LPSSLHLPGDFYLAVSVSAQSEIIHPLNCEFPINLYSLQKGKNVMNQVEEIQTTVNAYKSGQKSIDQTILEAIAQARATCDKEGKDSPNCIEAWEILEELQTEKAMQQQVKRRKTDLEIYCEMYPEALECLIYDV